MDNNSNDKKVQRASSSSKKFNTELFNRPFTGSNENNNQIMNNSIISNHSKYT